MIFPPALLRVTAMAYGQNCFSNSGERHQYPGASTWIPFFKSKNSNKNTKIKSNNYSILSIIKTS